MLYLLLVGAVLSFAVVKSYVLVDNYAGQNFFDGWTFYGSWDNLTDGDVWWVNQADAVSDGLAYINKAGNAILKVDNVSWVTYGNKRNSVRITTQATYGVGSLWIIDLLHIPYGCSVWPAFWTLGQGTWPSGGEIDIIEGINLMDNNQMAVHTTPGCYHTTPTDQLGISGETDCSQSSGCLVTEIQPNSYLNGFSEAGGGVWATQFDVAGIFIWFWSRPNVPEVIKNMTGNSIDISSFGNPSASYPASSCNMSQYFTAQNLVLDITLCGQWAALPQYYNASCGSSGTTGVCYTNNVVGSGAPTYDNAYFEISYIKAFTTPAPATATSGSTNGGAQVASMTAVATPSRSASSQRTSSTSTASSATLFEMSTLSMAFIMLMTALITL